MSYSNNDEYDYIYDNYIDYDIVLKERKTISNVLTVEQAIKSNKASKNHKLYIKRYHHKTNKVDLTKSHESKKVSKIISSRI